MRRLLLLLTPLLLASTSTQELLCEAHELYERGEASCQVEERRQLLNQALERYRTLALQGESRELYYNLGACCQQLNEMGWAVYYFQKGGFSFQVNHARAQLGLAPLPHPFAFNRWLIGVAVASGLLLLVGSGAIWLRKRALLRWTLSLSLLVALGYGALVYLHSFAPPSGVIVRSSSVKEEPEGRRIALVPAGTLVKRVSFVKGGEWVVATTESGDRGYLPTNNVQIINKYY